VTIFDFVANSISGEQIPLSRFRGKVLLIVNTASKCRFTPQYAGLERLHEQFSSRGFSVLGFPCNQFGQQEPETAKEIQKYCSSTFNVTFPLFDKVDVNGDGAHSLFKFLKKTKPGVLGVEFIKWNFTKFLVDRNGVVTKRFGPLTKPAAIAADIKKLLADCSHQFR
jgi:glutathione peroxidase